MRTGMELADRYELAGLIGRGGMGEVWRATDRRLRRPVAVKILPLAAGADATEVARFRREAEIAAQLVHPGITTVFDVGEHHDGTQPLLFLVMELMRGRDLQHTIAGHPGGLPLEQALDLAAQVLEALAAAHAHGIVHRDIKPANLFLLDGGRVKICDFGIARLAGATQLTATGAIAGTPLYMAPEQINGATGLDHRTDLYAFGCVLYQLLTGSPWVDTATGNIGSILYQHIDKTPPAPGTVRAGIPAHLDALVLDLLAKHPADRPEDAHAALARLRPPAGQPQPPVPLPVPTPTAVDTPKPPRAAEPPRAIEAPRRPVLLSPVTFDDPRVIRARRRRIALIGACTLLAAGLVIAFVNAPGSSPDTGAASAATGTREQPGGLPVPGRGPTLTPSAGGPAYVQLYQPATFTMQGGSCPFNGGSGWGVQLDDPAGPPHATARRGNVTYQCDGQGAAPVLHIATDLVAPVDAPKDLAGCLTALQQLDSRQKYKNTALTYDQLTAGTRFCLDSSDQSGHSVMYLELRVKDPDRDLTFTATAWKQSAH